MVENNRAKKIIKSVKKMFKDCNTNRPEKEKEFQKIEEKTKFYF
jgi:hypothetical protein